MHLTLVSARKATSNFIHVYLLYCLSCPGISLRDFTSHKHDFLFPFSIFHFPQYIIFRRKEDRQLTVTVKYFPYFHHINKLLNLNHKGSFNQKGLKQGNPLSLSRCQCDGSVKFNPLRGWKL